MALRPRLEHVEGHPAALGDLLHGGRRRDLVTGDLTSAFNFVKVNTSVPSLPRVSLTDSRVTMSTCATSAPLDLATDTTNSLKTLEETLVANYPVTVNSSAPPQESGSMPAPSGPVPCTK